MVLAMGLEIAVFQIDEGIDEAVLAEELIAPLIEAEDRDATANGWGGRVFLECFDKFDAAGSGPRRCSSWERSPPGTNSKAR